MGTKVVCVRCGEDVKGLKPGIGGRLVHAGHVDARLDQTCGTWGFRRKHPGAVSLGRKGGRATSRAKVRASRANGKLGGRPKKT